MHTLHRITAITFALLTALTVVVFAANSDLAPSPDTTTAEGAAPDLPHAHDKVEETDGESEEEIAPDAAESEDGDVDDSKAENSEAENSETENAESEDNTPVGRILDVPYINQRVGFPNGCESVSTVMALQYLGIEITPNDFIENYLAAMPLSWPPSCSPASWAPPWVKPPLSAVCSCP